MTEDTMRDFLKHATLDAAVFLAYRVRTRKTPNASVEIGYRSAIAVHMANSSCRRKQRITLEEAKSAVSQF